jgi:hypothetical protein
MLYVTGAFAEFRRALFWSNSGKSLPWPSHADLKGLKKTGPMARCIPSPPTTPHQPELVYTECLWLVTFSRSAVDHNQRRPLGARHVHYGCLSKTEKAATGNPEDRLGLAFLDAHSRCIATRPGEAVHPRAN